MQDAKNYNEHIINLLLNSLSNKEASVLDFGAGYGFFANMLRERGVKNIDCVEIDEELKEHCEDLDFTVFNDLGHIDEKKCDFIYTLNVLEHIKNDKKVILNLKSKLKDNGKLFIYVPAFQLLYSNFDKEIGHCRRYTKNKIIKFMKENGFENIPPNISTASGLCWLFFMANQQRKRRRNLFSDKSF